MSDLPDFTEASATPMIWWLTQVRDLVISDTSGFPTAVLDDLPTDDQPRGVMTSALAVMVALCSMSGIDPDFLDVVIGKISNPQPSSESETNQS